MIKEIDNKTSKKVILEYDPNKYRLIKSKVINGGYTLSLIRKYQRCSCCGDKVYKENWGGHILKKEYRDRRKAVIYKQEQKDFVCNKCIKPEVRRAMELLGYCNRK